ncbi:tetratricopeptide repeat protein [Nocardia sp. SSK8]|uniref:tetratricopeptide repeat protein n=1 Tax=Nocardia sp. SSK8 TaxID=3120154 RepID=UPI003008BE03
MENNTAGRSTTPAFTGHSRAGVVDGLGAVWGRLPEVPRRTWISLEGAPGAGKTRIVHEFYRRLAAGQQGPAYWPPTILGEDEPIGPRKVAGPTAWERPAGALPGYLWLGFSGRRGDGLPEIQLSAELRQIDAHFPLVQRRAGLVRQARGAAAEFGGQVGKMSVEELAVQGIEAGLKLVGAQIPGVGPAVHLGGLIAARIRAERDLTGRVGTEEEVDLRAVAGHAVDEFLRKIGAVLAVIPVVIFVEDLHESHPVLLDALKRLLAEERGPLLVITSEWERGNQRLAEPAVDRWVTVTESGVHTPDPLLAQCFPAGASLAPLTVDERAALIGELVPHAHPDAARMLAAQYPNLHMLLLVCGLRRTREALAARSLDPRLLHDLPRRVEQFLDESWATLDHRVRDRLRRVACATPASIEEADHRANLYFDERCDLSLLLPAPAADRFVDQAVRRHWLCAVDGPVYAFVDRQRRGLALRDAADEDLGPEIRGLLALRTHDPDWAAPEDPRRGIRDSLIVALARAGYDVHVESLVAACCRLVFALRADYGDIPLLGEISGTAVAGAQAAGLPRDPQLTLLTEMWARSLAEQGEHRTALTVLAPLLDTDLPEEQRLRIEWLYARAERVAVGADAALRRFDSVAQRQRALLGPDAPGLLTTRCDIAYTHAVKGEYGAAQAILHDVLATTWAPGAERDLPRAEHQMASVLRRRGDLAGAAAIAEPLLDRQRRLLGRTHPDTLATQQLVVAVLRDRGRLTEAMAQAEDLRELRTRVLGASQSTREATSHVAWLHRKLGHHAEAAAMFRTLAAQGGDVDADHWTTLRDLHNYAVCRRDAGFLDEALETLTGVQARAEARDSARIEIIETVRERGRTLLHRYVETGAAADLTQGRALLREALERAGQRPDMSAPMRWQLAIDARCADALDGGPSATVLRELAALCRGQLADLGARHPEVLRSELYLAEAYRERGNPALARLLVDDVAAKCARFGLDPAHRLTRMVDELRQGKAILFR